MSETLSALIVAAIILLPLAALLVLVAFIVLTIKVSALNDGIKKLIRTLSDLDQQISQAFRKD